MGEDLRHRYAEAVVASLGQTSARPTLATEVVAAAGSMATAAFAAADAVLAVRDEELERLRYTVNTGSRIIVQLREEITRLRINAEKDVCSGCMQREEARDRAMESARQTGVKYEGAKQRWYEAQDRAEDAEQEREALRERAETAESRNARARALHPSAEEAHATQNALCVECCTPAPCATRKALDSQDTDHG